MAISLPEQQKKRLRNLESYLDKYLLSKDYVSAKKVVCDIQSILRVYKNYPRLYQSKIKLIELSIELNDYVFAITNLKAARSILNKNTRIYLEASSLLAICYLRMQSIDEAKHLIREVLTNETVIKTERTRKIFHTEIINRFNEEVALCSIKSDSISSLDEVEIEKTSIRLLTTSTEEEIFEKIGEYTPKTTKDLIYIIHDFSTKQLTAKERLALPSPALKTEASEVGVTIFNAVKRVLYNSLCNPESDIYKAWFNNGMQLVLSKGYIKTAVITCLCKLGVGIPMIAASLIALISKFGIEVYCEKNKPKYLLDIRSL